MKREHKNTPGEKKHLHDYSPAFIERTATLKEISEILNSGRNVLIVGQPKSGKTTIVSELKRTLAESHFECVLLELSQVPMTPEFYSVFAIKEMKKEFSKRKPETDAEKHVSEIISESEREIEGELLKVKPDHSRMIESVRDAMNKISARLKQQKKKLLVIIDDGEELLNLENFPQVKSVLDMAGIENGESSEAPLFLITTSYSRAFGTSLSHFEKVNLKKYNDEEIKEFRDYHKIKHHWETLLNLTDRHPFVLNALARAMREKESLEEAVILEFLNPDSATFQFFSAWVNDALSKARGATLQKAIL
ncbi:ATP-binding protein, partial [Candidatus Woesearchaeota archaeon]